MNSFFAPAFEELQFIQDPLPLFGKKLFNARLLCSKRSCKNYGAIGIYRKAHVFCSFTSFERICNFCHALSLAKLFPAYTRLRRTMQKESPAKCFTTTRDMQVCRTHFAQSIF